MKEKPPVREHITQLIEASAQNKCVVENAVKPAAQDASCAAEDLVCKIQETHNAAAEREPVTYGRRATDKHRPH